MNLFRDETLSMLSLFLKRLRWLLLGGTITNIAQATVYPLPPPDTDVIGEIKVIYARKEETLLDIARDHDLGYDEIVHANLGIDRWAPGEGTPIVLPTRFILPDTPREGIVLNIAEMRLYYYPPPSASGERVVHTYPVSIGRMDWKTPMGLTKVVGKEVDPPWRPPASIKAEHAAEGDMLPDVVPGGSDNPLGRFAMRLGVAGSYLIHGTNKPYGIGMRVTHGCVRLYPEDIEQLFWFVPVGTPVRLLDQPVKVGRLNGELLVESHEPLEEDELPMKVTLEQAEKAVIAKVGPDMAGVDQAALRAAVEQVSGMPVSISMEPGSSTSLPIGQPTAPPPVPNYPTANRTPSAYPANRPEQRDLPASTASTASTGSTSTHPTANQPSSAYPAPYTNSSMPPTAYRPAPAAPSRAPYASVATDREEPPYRPAPSAAPRPVDTPAYTYRPASNTAAPVDTPAYRSAPTSLPVETPAYRSAPIPSQNARSPGAAHYEEPPPLSRPATAAAASPATPPAYRPVPPGSPVPYPKPVTPMVLPSAGNTSADE